MNSSERVNCLIDFLQRNGVEFRGDKIMCSVIDMLQYKLLYQVSVISRYDIVERTFERVMICDVKDIEMCLKLQDL